ncbi:hypothetical protein QBC46DRAFT_271798 [Diplogelasinospora grovesii]|uniref:Yeast cell wall synthesis Kre9/Knh1-like N-terminal domain-containing protein n=1 Tax=Diplogelasinospora grovesii TaxID=303347 RepID=A0AAN6S0E4_9PEZI|nr:hypothetical protein QBC46DRAFT_271798 [Diplogelasinospora grovesii]
MLIDGVALHITDPTDGAQWDFSATNTVKWEFVSSDPTSFQLVLVNHATQPETDTVIAESVNTTAGSYSFTNVVAKPGSQYTIKAMSTSTQNSGQLAESQTFNVTKSGVAPTTTSSSGSGASATGSQTSASATSTKNAAVTLGKAFGVAGPVAVGFAMLL